MRGTAVPEISAFLDVLQQQSHPDGGWGYAPGLIAQLEPTCLGVLALSLEADRFQGTIDKAHDFLIQNAGADGGFRLAMGRPEAVWPTSLVLFTLLGSRPVDSDL